MIEKYPFKTQRSTNYGITNLIQVEGTNYQSEVKLPL